jgi:hypothetical protein
MGLRLGMMMRQQRLKTRVANNYEPDFGLPGLAVSGNSAAPAAPKPAGGKCWLKDAAPDPREVKGLTSGIVRASAVYSSYEQNYYRDGPHYREFDLAQADPKLCQKACIGESRCAAWNYRKPEGRTDLRPHCWLLDRALPSRTADGLMAGGAVTRPGATSFEEETDRSGQDYRQFDLSVPDPRLCQRQCIDDARCRAWAYKTPPPPSIS